MPSSGAKVGAASKRGVFRAGVSKAVAGAALEGQRRYAGDVRLCLKAYFEAEPMEKDHLIVQDGEIVSGSYRAIYG